MNLAIQARISGIPCIVEVTAYNVAPPDFGADNPSDYYGYTELEYEVLDRRGRPAPWLERKLEADSVRDKLEEFLELKLRADKRGEED